MFNYKIKQPTHAIVTKTDGSKWVRITQPKREHFRGMHLNNILAEVPLPDGIDPLELLKEFYKEERI